MQTPSGLSAAGLTVKGASRRVGFADSPGGLPWTVSLADRAQAPKGGEAYAPGHPVGDGPTDPSPTQHTRRPTSCTLTSPNVNGALVEADAP